MTEITTARIVAVLEKLPEKRFRISELAPQLLDDKGQVDIAKAIDRQGELNLALVEVRNYIKAVREVRGELESLSRDGRWTE